MLIIAFLSLLVFSTYSTSLLINRVTIILLVTTLFIFNSSFTLFAINEGLALFNDWFIIFNNNIYFINIIFLTVILLFIYKISIASNTNNNISQSLLESKRYSVSPEVPLESLIIIANIIGLILFPLVNDLLSLYILIELQSYSLYILTGLNNKSYNASRAALLYFLMGGVASCLILLAVYFIYSTLGTSNLQEIWNLLYYTNSTVYNNNINTIDTPNLTIGIYILIIALLFKMGLAPLHRWSIAVYNYAPTYITAYISIVAKISIISFILTWAAILDVSIIYIFFISSLIIGAYKPLYQVNIKTILAYSGLLNFSYILLSVIINSEISNIALYIYLLQYVITHILIFIIILTMGHYYITSPISTWSPLTFIHQLNIPNKALSGCLIIALFSLIGLPPLPGFYAKLLIFTGALSANYILEALLIVFFSVIATYYYANIIKVLMKNPIAKDNNISPILAYIISFVSMLLLFVWTYLDIILQGIYLFIL